jgi:hypothetical protein
VIAFCSLNLKLPAIARAALITTSRAEVGGGTVVAVVVMMQASRANAWAEVDTTRTRNPYRTEEAASSRVTGSWVVAKANADSAP